MQKREITSTDLAGSVIAVPPLARDPRGRFDQEENAKLIRHIESGSVTTLLYGGNANFYHVAPSEYDSILAGIANAAAEDTLVVPAAGPAYGMMMDQAGILRDHDFPTVMALPQQGVTTSAGVAEGLRRFSEKMEKPIVVYIKSDDYIDPVDVKKLEEDGCISWIKYATVRDDTRNDVYLSELVDLVNPERIVSGIGEQPAIIHMREFGLVGYTSGCVCIRPDLSARMLEACRDGDWSLAEEIRRQFSALEDIRNQINPIRVLHKAVAMADLADTGPQLPFLSDLADSEQGDLEAVVTELLNC